VTRLRRRLVDQLTGAGYLTSPEWIDAFATVPREKFAPRYFLFTDGGGHTAIDQSDHEWLDPLYLDRVLPTQLDGDPDAWNRARGGNTPIDGVPTCSLSQPSLTAVMLEALDVHDGHHVLEVELAVRFHHRLVSIHLFPSGNGRHARLAADVVVVSLGRPRFSWGSGGHLAEAPGMRHRYLAALRAADRDRAYEPLLEFARS